MTSKASQKKSVHVCVWETRGNDPCVFIAKTEKRLYEAVWETVREYWMQEVGDRRPPTNPEAGVTEYARACLDRERGEYFTFSKEKIL